MPEPPQWVVWNGASGLLAMATLGRIDTGAAARQAWLAPPFEMVGPFDLDELLSQGRIAFAACTVMSRERWQADQVALRQAAHDQRRAARQRWQDEQARSRGGNAGRWARGLEPVDERQHRATLNLPSEGALAPAQIKAAFRRLAQKAHPDRGGSHERFVRLAEARDALLPPRS